jgi:phytoene synthase
MQADLEGKQYRKLDDSLWYVYGSAEAVGLMMAKLMNLTPESYNYAKVQGRAMQWVNFIRDLQEDNEMGRRYFPMEDLKACNLKDLSEATARKNPAAFRRLMKLELKRYQEWQDEARKGLFYIPGMLRPALTAAIDMYDWTAAQIAKDPFVVFTRKVKPTKRQVLAAGLRNIVIRTR